ncbi:MAG: hypothetical protein EAY69_05345 [Cytophagales bacterium]|nr:MAG: hypothetical protein EAY69_05345 [Cytophagales bacterium]
MVDLGKNLRELHLLESPKLTKLITTYPINGTNKVDKVVFENGKVYINYDNNTDNSMLQYFENVPLIAWDFYIGGYQPAQKWLKDRKDTQLSFEDIAHYQKIIVLKILHIIKK